MTRNRYAFLDGIRGIAAIFVLTRHTENYWNFSLYRSYLAVDLFFILSGFVISCAYDEKLKTGVISFKKFITIRLVRLYPAFLVSLVICSIILIFRTVSKHHENQMLLTEAVSLIIATAFFLPYKIGGNSDLFPINGPYWSLFFELVVNAIYAAARPL